MIQDDDEINVHIDNKTPDETDQPQIPFEISDDEVNNSCNSGLSYQPTTNSTDDEVKINETIDIDSTISNYDYDVNLIRSLIENNEKSILEEMNNDDRDYDAEDDEVNRSVNEYVFKLAGRGSTVKKTSVTSKLSAHRSKSSSKMEFKRYASEPYFGHSKTPRRLEFQAISNDDVQDRLSPLPIGADDMDDVLDTSEIPYNFYNPIGNEQYHKSFTINPATVDFDEFDALVGYDEEVAKSINSLNQTINLNETNVHGDNYIYKTESVTPKPDFVNITIESIHAELNKFGIKKLSRSKAILLLEHIYNNTHPIIDDKLDDRLQITLSQPVTNNMEPLETQTAVVTTTIGTFSGIDFSAVDDDADLLKPSNFSPLINYDDAIYFPSKPRSSKVQYCPVPLHVAFHNLFQANSKLRRSILMYRPIELERLYAHFKAIGLKFETNVNKLYIIWKLFL